MKRFFTLFLAFALTGGMAAANDNYIPGSIAIQPKIDSMKQLLTVRSIAEEQKMEIYRLIAEAYHAFNHDSTVYYAHKSMSLARKHKSYAAFFGNYSILGVTHCFNSNYDSAFIYFNSMKELALDRKNKKEETNALTMLAFAYAKQGKYNTSVEYYLKVLEIAESEKWTSGIVGILVNLSEINRRLGNTEIAIQYLKQAEDNCNTWFLNNTGRYAWYMPNICNEYAFNYLNMGDFDMAFRYAVKADSINPGTSVNSCYSNGLLAAVYLQWNDYGHALQYAQKSYERANELKDKNLYAYAGKILSDVYMAQKRYPEAEAAALKVWLADSTYIDESRDAVGNIVMANIYMRQTERAAYYLKRYSELNAQFAEKSFQTTVSDMMIQYDTEKKETRIATLEKERNLYTGLGIACLLFAVSLGFVLWQTKRNARKEKQLIASRAILDGEMKERARLAQDLHDRLSGNLSAVKIELNKHADTLHHVREQLDNCIRDIRDAAHDLMPASLQFGMKVALEDFAAKFPNVRFHFFGTERRMGERLEYVVYCCANELVNNAIKHSGAKNINMQLVQDEKHVTLTVSDDGCGFVEKSVTKGFGLKSIRNRVASCNGKIDIESLPGKGTETTIELRIEN